MMTDDERLPILLVVSISNYNYYDDKTMRFEIPIELLAIIICIFSFAATSYISFALYRAKYYSTAAGSIKLATTHMQLHESIRHLNYVCFWI
jgi:hypothetical protein